MTHDRISRFRDEDGPFRLQEGIEPESEDLRLGKVPLLGQPFEELPLLKRYANGKRISARVRGLHHHQDPFDEKNQFRVDSLGRRTSAFPSLSGDEREGRPMSHSESVSEMPRTRRENVRSLAGKLKVRQPENGRPVSDAIDVLASLLIDMAVAAGKVPACRG